MKSLNKENVLDEYYDLVKKKTHEQCELERDNRQNAMEPFETYCARQEKQALDSAKAYLEECHHVFQVIIGELAAGKDHKTINELVQGAEHFISLRSERAEDSGKTLRELFSYSPELMEKIYQVGLSCLERGHIVDASKVFSFLILLDPGYAATWTMLGLSLKLDRHWAESLAAFEMALEIDDHNPLAYFHEAACLKELGRLEEARQALDKTLLEIPTHPEFKHLERLVKAEKAKF